MIRILRGPGEPRAARSLEVARSAERAVVLPPSRADGLLPDRSWDGVRRLLAGLAELDGAQAVEAVLRRHRPAAALLLPRLGGGLDAAEARAVRLKAARETSHLSHNLLVQRPLFEAWARLLAELLAATTVVIPDLAGLDRETLAALRTLARRHPGELPDLVVGLDDRLTRPPLDADGLLWRTPPEDLLEVVLGFQTLQGTVTEEPRADGAASGGAPGAEKTSLDPRWEDGDEAFARERLLGKGRSMPLEAVAVERVVRALISSFERYSFTTTLRLGRALLGSGVALEPSTRARVHGLVALAAHNRQFRTLGNRALAETLERYLLEAWAGESDPARRSAVAYRLAVTTGRRKKDAGACLLWSERAVEEARRGDLDPDLTAHLEAWGRNIRAYGLLRDGRPGEGVEECEAAFELLDARLREESSGEEAPVEAAAGAPDALVREMAFTHALVADNLAALAEIRGDRRAFLEWKRRAESPMAGFPGLLRFEGTTWIRFHRQAHRLDRALPRALEALEAARREQDAPRLYRYTVQAADLLDRSGRSEEALMHFCRARELRGRMGDPAFLRPVVAAHAGAALRAGRPEEARYLLLDELRERSSGEGDAAASPAATAELRGALALATAAAGDEGGAEEEANRAIAAAVASGSRDVLLRVAVTVGEANLRLGRKGEAREAFRRALEIAGAGDEPVPPADLLAARLGLREAGGHPDGGVEATLELLEPALDDAATWALLPRLAAWVELEGSGGEEERALLTRVLEQRRGPGGGREPER